MHEFPSDDAIAHLAARVLDAAGDARALRVAIEQLAHDAITPQERARHYTYAAEIDELTAAQREYLASWTHGT